MGGRCDKVAVSEDFHLLARKEIRELCDMRGSIVFRPCDATQMEAASLAFAQHLRGLVCQESLETTRNLLLIKVN